MAKALEDGTIPCPKCGNIMTVETQKKTGGPNGEREVFIKCLRCNTETLMGVYKLYGNSLIKQD